MSRRWQLLSCVIWWARDAKRKKDTSLSLNPLTIKQAIKVLAQPKRKGSQAEESDKSKSRDPESEPSKVGKLLGVGLS
jgi:hypothetical protein